MAENSQTVTLVAATATPLSWGGWYPEIVVANDGSGAVFARTDGTAATGGTGDVNVPSGTTATLGNLQPEPEPDNSTVNPVTTPGWTSQSNRTVYTSGHP